MMSLTATVNTAKQSDGIIQDEFDLVNDAIDINASDEGHLRIFNISASSLYAGDWMTVSVRATHVDAEENIF